MKTLRIETGTEIRRANKGDLVSYPIQSIKGARGTGWINRELPEDTIIVTLDSIDGIGGGFAVSTPDLCQSLGLCDRGLFNRAMDCVSERGAIIGKQDKQIEALKKKIERSKRAAQAAKLTKKGKR